MCETKGLICAAGEKMQILKIVVGGKKDATKCGLIQFAWKIQNKIMANNHTKSGRKEST